MAASALAYLNKFAKATVPHASLKTAGNEAGNEKGYVTSVTIYATVSTIRMATVAQEMML